MDMCIYKFVIFLCTKSSWTRIVSSDPVYEPTNKRFKNLVDKKRHDALGAPLHTGEEEEVIAVVVMPPSQLLLAQPLH